MSANDENQDNGQQNELDPEASLICRNLVMGSFKKLMEELDEHDNHEELFSPVILNTDNSDMTGDVEKAVWHKVEDVAEEMNPPRKYVSELKVDAELNMAHTPPRCQITYWLGDINLNREFNVDLGLEIGDKNPEATEEIDDSKIDV